MRFMKVAATIGVAVAMAIGTAGIGSAAQKDNKTLAGAPARETGISTQRTSGHSFWEINASGQLVYWTRSGSSFSGTVRGQGWENTRQITALNANVFLEIKQDYRLARWTWTGNGFTQEIVGTGWEPARVISGIDDDRFLEIKNTGQLVEWKFNGSNLSAFGIGFGWDLAKTIAGLGGPEDDIINFMEIKNTGAVAEWYGTHGNLQQQVYEGVDFSDVRLIVGTDPFHFVYIANDGALIEFTLTQEGEEFVWRGAQVGQGWQGTKLIG